MTWEKEFIYVRQYEFVSCNQHGDRFKRTPPKQLKVAKISCKTNDTDGMQKLILLSHTLDVPVRYDFDDGMVHIKIVSDEALRGCI